MCSLWREQFKQRHRGQSREKGGHAVPQSQGWGAVASVGFSGAELKAPPPGLQKANSGLEPKFNSKYLELAPIITVLHNVESVLIVGILKH